MVILLTKGNQMKSLKDLQQLLTIVIHADKELEQGMALYQVKSLFDNLQLNGFIDFDSQHGELIQVVLDTKRKDVAAKNIIYVRSILQTIIKEKELEQAQLVEAEREQDSFAIESTCITVTRNDKEKIQLQLNDIPKTLGRPKLANALTGAQRAKKARDKKKANDLVTVNSTLSKHASELYCQMIDSGYDLNDIIANAYNQTPLKK